MRVVPNESRSFTVLEMLPPAAALGLLYAIEKDEFSRLKGVPGMLGPVKPWRKE